MPKTRSADHPLVLTCLRFSLTGPLEFTADKSKSVYHIQLFGDDRTKKANLREGRCSRKASREGSSWEFHVESLRVSLCFLDLETMIRKDQDQDAVLFHQGSTTTSSVVERCVSVAFLKTYVQSFSSRWCLAMMTSWKMIARVLFVCVSFSLRSSHQ